MSRATRVAIIAVMQTLVLVAMIGMRQWTLATGVPVELETEPVDPRSLFSGDYVRLGYKISQLRFDELKGDTGFKRYDRVFVALAPDGPYWKAQGVYRQRVSVPEGQVAIKGEVQSVSDMLWDQGANVTRQIGNMNVVYGIENYFVPEGEGRDLERPRAGEKITIRVAVDRFGNAGIKAVLVNGNPRYEEKLF